MEFDLKLCKSKVGLEVKPIKKVNLDLRKLEKNFTVIFRTPYMLVLNDWGEVIVHKNGNVVFKSLEDESKVMEIAGDIYREAS